MFCCATVITVLLGRGTVLHIYIKQKEVSLCNTIINMKLYSILIYECNLILNHCVSTVLFNMICYNIVSCKKKI